jgi:hypothetical protein
VVLETDGSFSVLRSHEQEAYGSLDNVKRV